jgi:hypothetical protein
VNGRGDAGSASSTHYISIVVEHATVEGIMGDRPLSNEKRDQHRFSACVFQYPIS